MGIDQLQHGFTYLLLERVNPEQNENRFYYQRPVSDPRLKLLGMQRAKQD